MQSDYLTVLLLVWQGVFIELYCSYKRIEIMLEQWGETYA